MVLFGHILYLPSKLVTVRVSYSVCHTGEAAVEGLCDDDATAAYCLHLPGKILYLSPLLAQKKFRKRGNKDGAVRAFYQLDAEGLGKVLEVGCGKGTSVVSMCCCVS